MKITKETLKSPQIDFAMHYIWENKFTYQSHPKKELQTFVCSNLGIVEFGVGGGSSLKKITDYLKDNDFTNIHVMGYDSWEGLPKEKEGIEIFPKFIEGAYKYNFPLAAANDNVFLRKCTFDQIPDEDANRITMAALIHIDSDLYISAYQALDWCFRNNLVVKHTLIAFDEYMPNGEAQAWKDIVYKYGFTWREVFHYSYNDKDYPEYRIRQNVFEIEKI